VRAVLGNVASVTNHAVACRVAATVGRWTSLRVAVDVPADHDVTAGDPAAAQARDEHEQVRRARSFASAFRADDRSQAAQFVDAAREEHMADRLAELSADGGVVGVVGIDHLDALVSRLESASV
jgi:hypothetical protein